MRSLLALVLFGGCSIYFGPDDGDGPEPEQHRPDAAVVSPDAEVPGPPPGTCTHDVALTLGDDMFVDLPVMLDLANVCATNHCVPDATVCIRLDSTARTHPTYFEASTPMEAGPPASFGVAIYDVAEQLLADGYDAQIAEMQTYATATYNVQTNSVFFVKVRVWARSSAQDTQLSLSLYQILD